MINVLVNLRATQGVWPYYYNVCVYIYNIIYIFYCYCWEKKRNMTWILFAMSAKNFHYTHISTHWEPQTPTSRAHAPYPCAPCPRHVHGGHLKRRIRLLRQAFHEFQHHHEARGAPYPGWWKEPNRSTTGWGPRWIAFSCRTFLWLNSMVYGRYILYITIVNGGYNGL